VGEAILKIRGLLTQWHWYWICVSILFGYAVVFNILSIFALEFMDCKYQYISQMKTRYENIVYIYGLFTAPHKHQVNIKAAEANLEYRCQMDGNGNVSTDQAVLPFRPLSLVFDHISYFVDMPKVIPQPLETYQTSVLVLVTY
jgi:hypothetical protein